MLYVKYTSIFKKKTNNEVHFLVFLTPHILQHRIRGSKIMELFSWHGQRETLSLVREMEGRVPAKQREGKSPRIVFSLDPPLEGVPVIKQYAFQQGRQQQPRLCIRPSGGYDTEWVMKLQLF